MSTLWPSVCPDCGTPSSGGVRCARCSNRGSGSVTEEPIRYIGDYELLSLLGRGGMGVVYRARQRTLNRLVALKLLLGGNHARESFKLRFRQEAQLAARLRHPGIASIYETGEHEGQPFIAMELIEGRDLASLTDQGPIAPAAAARHVLSAAQAIQYAHEQGILHRDLKPANLLLGSDGQIRITDFGLAQDINSDLGLTLTGSTLGSPGYMPPEQVALTRANIGPSSDVYSLGAVLYHLLCGRAPFVGMNVGETLEMIGCRDPVPPRELNPAVPVELERVCLKCLEKNPLRRYRSARALGEDLARWLELPGSEPTSQRQSRNTWLRLTPVILAATAIIGVLAWQSLHHNAASRSSSKPQPKPISNPALNAGQLVTGYLKQELFHGVPGPGIGQFTNSWRFPAFPDQVLSLASFESPMLLPPKTGMRISGFLVPPVTGLYTFYLAAGDEAVLLLGDAQNRAPTPIAWEVTNWDPQRQPARSWASAESRASSSASKPVSAPIPLEAGRHYKIELLTMRLSHLASYSGVAWRLPDDPVLPDGAPPIPGASLAYHEPASPIAVQPAETVAAEGDSVWLRVGVSSPRWDGAQWWRQGVMVPQATNFLLKTPPLRRTDSGTAYYCVLTETATGKTFRSPQTVVKVVPDQQFPRLLAAAALPDTNLVSLTFDERLDAISATNARNYYCSISELAGVLLSPDERHVLLMTRAQVRSPFDVRVSGLADWSGNRLPATNISGVLSSFHFVHFVNRDWGRRQQGLVIPSGATDFEVYSRGRGYGGHTPPREDDLEFIYQPVVGDFEVSVRVSRFDDSDNFAQAGLMVRASLAPDAAHLNLHVNPPDGSGHSFINYTLDQPGPRAFPTDASLGAGPSGVPNAWLKIRRTGDLFSFFRSQDGKQWKLVRTHRKVFASEVFVGTASAAAYGSATGGWISYRQLVVTP